jgi:hypothetical protein
VKLAGLQFQASLGKKNCETTPHLNVKKNKTKLSVVAGACHPSVSAQFKMGGSLT